MNKSTCLALLVCVNLLLLTGIVLCASSPSAAYAQGPGLAQDYMAVAGKVQDGRDALYIIDVRNRTLHVLRYELAQRRLQYGGYQDLERDFRHNRG
jgi:hypothetical protein